MTTNVTHFEDDLRDLFKDKIRDSDEFCSQVWSALANIEWTHEDGDVYSCSFRYAGEVIAHIRGNGGYMDWYCSGPYAEVSNEIANGFKSKGWDYDDRI